MVSSAHRSPSRSRFSPASVAAVPRSTIDARDASPGGGLLEVLATAPAAMLDFRHYARQSGHTLVSAEDGAELRFVLRRES